MIPNSNVTLATANEYLRSTEIWNAILLPNIHTPQPRHGIIVIIQIVIEQAVDFGMGLLGKTP
jgi:hypothetical protein